MASNTDTRPHGDEAIRRALNPLPKRSRLGGFTLHLPKRAPIAEPVPHGPPPKPAYRVVDAIAPIYAPQPRRQSVPRTSGSSAPLAATVDTVVYRQPVRTVGVVAILDALRRRDIRVELSADRQHIVPRAPGGRLLADQIELLQAAAPLLLGHLRGEPVMCAVRPHQDPAEAVTILVGGAAACAACLAERQAES